MQKLIACFIVFSCFFVIFNSPLYYFATDNIQDTDNTSSNAAFSILTPEEQKLLESSKKDFIIKLKKDFRCFSLKNINLSKKSILILYCIGTVVLTTGTYIICNIIHERYFN